MIPEIRQKKMLEILSKAEITAAEDLRLSLHISSSTLRRDLAHLSSEHKITLLHGGGIKLVQKIPELNLQTKMNLNHLAKERIARKAASIIEPDDVIFLDPSSTTYHMIPYLKDQNIMVITNSITHISSLIKNHIPCFMLGGSVKAINGSCIGQMAENMLLTFNYSKCFIGANGFQIQTGITNYDIQENAIKVKAIQKSAKTFFLLDSTKFNQVAMVKIADIDTYPIITDQIPIELMRYKNLICVPKEVTPI